MSPLVAEVTVTITPDWVMAFCAVATLVVAAAIFLWKNNDTKLASIASDVREMGEAMNGRFEGHTREIAELRGRFREMNGASNGET